MKASILFITYNHEPFISEAIRSAMAQDHPGLEIVVCDDMSTDRTAEILKEELKNCPAHIKMVWVEARNNVGLIENFNRGLSNCTGEVVVAMSGDDVSLPHRVSSICQAFHTDPEFTLVYSSCTDIDQNGTPLHRKAKAAGDRTFSYAESDDIYAGSTPVGATAAYRASFLNRFPPLKKAGYPEDNILWVRALLSGKVRYIGEPLVLRRTHDDNMSNWCRGADDTSSRQRHLRQLRTHEITCRQSEKDLRHALAAGWLSSPRYEKLSLSNSLRREKFRALRLSITPSTWKLWISSVLHFLRLSTGSGRVRKALGRAIRQYFRLRVSASFRQRYWEAFFSK